MRTTTTNDHLYAVIIVTEDAVMNPHQEYHNFFWDDASAMFCTLINVYGYSKDHIYVHYYDGTSPISEGDLDKDENQDNDIDYPASKSRIFDNINHAKLMLAVEKHVPENWVRLYIQRWLEMPVLTKSGELTQKQGKGTPQGGVISPLLANLFLHYAFDKWLEKTDGAVSFTRYADDVIVHCKSKVHAERTLNAIRLRMKSAGLELHPEKTKIVYCRDYRRKGKYPIVKFDFLGYSFQPRTSESKGRAGLFLGFDCAISIGSRKRIADKFGKLRVERLNFKSIVGIAQFLNPMIRGWVNYYSKFRGHELSKIFRLLDKRLIRWARKRYKRYKDSIRRAFNWLDRIREQFPYLFHHWRYSFCNYNV